MPIEVVGREGGSGAWAKATAGLHVGTLVRVEDLGPSQFDASKKRIQFVFALEDQQDDEGAPLELHHYANLVLSPKSDIAKFFAQMGKPWEPGQSVDLETLIGTRCQFYVTVSDGPNGPRPSISKETFMPVGGQAAQKPDDLPFAELDPCFICSQPGAAYDGRGRSVCEAHKSV